MDDELVRSNSSVLSTLPGVANQGSSSVYRNRMAHFKNKKLVVQDVRMLVAVAGKPRDEFGFSDYETID